MQQILNAKVSRSVVSATNVESTLRHYLALNLTYTDPTSGCAKNHLFYIFPNNEYTITWLSENGIQKTTGLVTGISGTSGCNGTITMKVLANNGNDDAPDAEAEKCYCLNAYQKRSNDPYASARITEMKKKQDMTKCPVLQDKDTSKYRGPVTVVIPIANISGIDYDVSENYPCLPPDQKPKGGTKIVILGISATTIRAVIVRLEFLEDDCPHDDEDAVRVVDMEVGKRYHVTYMCDDPDRTIFEIEGTLTCIEETGRPTDKPDNNMGTSTGNHCNCIVRQGKTEQVGFNNSAYGTTCKVEDFMNADPIENDVRFVFDTSEQFHSTEEVVWLSMLRNVEEIATGTPDEPVDPEDPPKDPICGDHCHHHHHHPQTYHIGSATVVVDGGTVVVKGHSGPNCGCNPGQDATLTMQEILEYYLGV